MSARRTTVLVDFGPDCGKQAGVEMRPSTCSELKKVDERIRFIRRISYHENGHGCCRTDWPLKAASRTSILLGKVLGADQQGA